MNKIAIVVVAYDRVNSLKRLLESLKNIKVPKEEEITLYISIDRDKNNGEKNKEVFNYAKEFKWEFGNKIVDWKQKNMGLRSHILECGNLTETYENIIVLEDDIVVSPLIYMYASQVIDFYKNDNNIAGFALYRSQRNQYCNMPFYPINNGSDVYFMQYACSWGQVWTKDRWRDFYYWYKKHKDDDFSNYLEIPNHIKHWGDNSWLKYHIIYTILTNKYFVYPYCGLTTNFSDIGIHNKTNNIAYQCNLISNNNEDIIFKFSELEKANNVYDAFFENTKLKELLNFKQNIIADFYGKKDIEYIKKQNGLLLSTKNYDFKILENYSLQMYPYEQNVINKINGEDIFLYDINEYQKNNHKFNRNILYRYLYRLDLFSKKDVFCIISLFISKAKNHIIGGIINKLKKIKK